MPFTNLAENLLHRDGILSKLKQIKIELAKLIETNSENASKTQHILNKKLDKLRADVKDVFFEPFNKAPVKEVLLSSQSCFSPDYLGLHFALRTLFSTLTIDEMIARISACPLKDWAPDEMRLRSYYEQFNTKYGYFTSLQPRKALDAIDLSDPDSKPQNIEFNQHPLLSVYRSLVMACRSVAVLIERNNTPNDQMAYQYAYKLMALFFDENSPILQFRVVSKKINQLLIPKDKKADAKEKPFHDVLLDLKLPPPPHDRSGWMALIEKEGRRVLPFFSMAAKMEKKTVDHKAPKAFNDAQRIMALLHYARAKEDPAFAQTCMANKVSQTTFNACLDFIGTPPVWPKKISDAIPALTIEEENGDYAWTKLPPSDKRGLILGKITGCCQSIGDDSEQCVKDASILSNNGLYVLLKRKKGKTGSCLTAKGLINDASFQIIGQSYVWITATGNLCLDSIEYLDDRIPIEKLSSILKSFAEQVLLQNPSIQRVTLGCGGSTPESLFEQKAILPEQMREGYFYGDATDQYLIEQQQSKITEKQAEWIKQFYQDTPEFSDCVLYFCEHMQDTSHVLEQLAMTVAADLSLRNRFSKESLFKLLRFTPRPTVDDLQPVNWQDPTTPPEQISAVHLLWQTDILNWRVIDLFLFFIFLLYRGLKPVNLMHDTPDGLNEHPSQPSIGRLFWQADTSENKLIVLSMLPSAERVSAVRGKDNDGRLLWPLSPDSPESLKMILELLPAKDRLSALSTTTANDSTVLHDVAKQAELLKMILTLLPPDDLASALNTKDNEGNNVFRATLSHPKSMNILLNTLPAEERFAVLTEPNNYGHTLLDLATAHPESMKIILTCLPANNALFTALTKIQPNRASVLHHAAYKAVSLRMILNRLPSEMRHSALNSKDLDGKTVLHWAANNPESLSIIFSLYSEKELLVALKEKNNEGQTVFDLADLFTNSLSMLLKRIPPNERLGVLKQKSNHIFLGQMRSYPDSLHKTLNSLSKSNLLKLIVNPAYASLLVCIPFLILKKAFISNLKKTDYSSYERGQLLATSTLWELKYSLGSVDNSSSEEEEEEEEEAQRSVISSQP